MKLLHLLYKSLSYQFDYYGLLQMPRVSIDWKGFILNLSSSRLPVHDSDLNVEHRLGSARKFFTMSLSPRWEKFSLMVICIHTVAYL